MVYTFMLRVHSIIDETKDTDTFRFHFHPDEDGNEQRFDWKPGQYVIINVPVMVDGKPKLLKRAYSISSSPTTPDYFDITIKEEPGGKVSTEMVEHMHKGTYIEVSGPYGCFVFEDNVEEVLLLGAGSGIAPLAAIMKYITDKDMDTPITFLYSAKTPQDLILDDVINERQHRHENFDYYLTITEPESYPDYHGWTGRVNEEMIRKTKCNLDKATAYICGPPGFVQAMVQILQKMGFSENRIKYEKYG